MATILGCFAHPDDEIFGTGGTFSQYAEQGVDIYLVCATRGEAGEIAEPHLATQETIAQVREAELTCAAQTLGAQAPIFLGYRDSGMAGTPENDDPRAFINAPADAVVAQLVALMRRLRPAAVVTFDPKGGYGHPDHIAIHKHTVAAFAKAGDATFRPDLGAAWQPARLFYRAMSRTQFNTMRDVLTAAGLDGNFYTYLEKHGMIYDDADITLTVDVRPQTARKLQAIRCHATQFGPDHNWRRATLDMAEQVMGREQFVLAYTGDAVSGNVMSGSVNSDRVTGLIEA